MYMQYSLLMFRHLVFGVGGTESCYLKQSILYNTTDWYAPEVRFNR
jgi:hypothetical protein